LPTAPRNVPEDRARGAGANVAGAEQEKAQVIVHSDTVAEKLEAGRIRTHTRVEAQLQHPCAASRPTI
jgi:hypothetical protein